MDFKLLEHSPPDLVCGRSGSPWQDTQRVIGSLGYRAIPWSIMRAGAVLEGSV